MSDVAKKLLEAVLALPEGDQPQIDGGGWEYHPVHMQQGSAAELPNEILPVVEEIEAFVHGAGRAAGVLDAEGARASAEHWRDLVQVVHARAEATAEASRDRLLLRTWVPLLEQAHETAERRVREQAPDDRSAWAALGVAAAVLLALAGLLGLAVVVDQEKRRTTRAAVSEESERFRRALPSLMDGPYANKWVVFSGGEVKSAHETPAEAVRSAVHSLGPDGGYVVAQVVADVRAS